ncbi:hypothetical protein NPIL_523911 [Nephila pilipes]|uniref:Uncharacterized protein n=1 Tax=Nephila pilipes TaxID=299642 RepID=A0A8X6I4Q4_NEPPI|nr:hypothetical protein NPIL_523911 [Nephila pilipes]
MGVLWHLTKTQHRSYLCSMVFTPNQSIHQQKVLLCIWFTSTGIVHFELLDRGKSITLRYTVLTAKSYYCITLEAVSTGQDEWSDQDLSR